MLDPIVNFFVRLFGWVGRGIGWVVGILLWPFIWLAGWYTGRGWALRSVVGLAIIGLIALYAYFFYQTQVWRNFNPDYPDARVAAAPTQTLAGDPVPPVGTANAQVTGAPNTTQPAPAPTAETCQSSAIVAVSADLIDFYVNQNGWAPSMIASKLGLFGIPWKNTPYFDNKAAFQLGMNNVIRRTTTELVDRLGRVRGTSQIDQNLQNARTNMSWDEEAWYIGWRGPTRPSPDVYREAIGNLRRFNDDLVQCKVTFDSRADNLQQFLDRIANDMDSTASILRNQIEASNAGWFDPRADDRFWFAYGQLYAYYGILKAAHKDFGKIIAERNLNTIWNTMEVQLRQSLNVQPWIISNGAESSSFFPSHLATMGFNLLRTRTQVTEITDVLER